MQLTGRNRKKRGRKGGKAGESFFGGHLGGGREGGKGTSCQAKPLQKQQSACACSKQVAYRSSLHQPPRFLSTTIPTLTKLNPTPSKHHHITLSSVTSHHYKQQSSAAALRQHFSSASRVFPIPNQSIIIMAGGKGKSAGGKSSGGKTSAAEGPKKQQSHSARAGLQV